MKRETVIVIDFGGQYNQLVARRVRECNVYCEIYSYRTDIETIKKMNPKGIILTGGPNSCYEPIPRLTRKNYSSLASRYWDYATAPADDAHFRRQSRGSQSAGIRQDRSFVDTESRSLPTSSHPPSADEPL